MQKSYRIINYLKKKISSMMSTLKKFQDVQSYLFIIKLDIKKKIYLVEIYLRV